MIISGTRAAAVVFGVYFSARDIFPPGPDKSGQSAPESNFPG